ncbi:MAG: prenyltransferase [Bacteroidales bacterium]|nr:prenyltransferase [Bacteroidales bacterium]
MATVKQWFLVVRPWSFPASTMPALVAVSYIFYNNFQINWLMASACVVGALIFHFSGNLISDYFDYKSGVDSEGNIGQTNLLIIKGIFKPKTILWYGIALGIVGVALGLFIVSQTNIGVLYVGLAGFALTFLYSPLKYNALGDLDIFLIFGVLIPLGTCLTLLGKVDCNVMAVSVPVGFFVVGILHANNTRDREIDHAASTRSFAMLIGLRAAKIYYTILEILPYIAIIVLVTLGITSWTTLAVLLSLPMAIKNIKAMKSSQKPEDIAALDGMSAKLVLVFSMLLVLANVISAFI